MPIDADMVSEDENDDLNHQGGGEKMASSNNDMAISLADDYKNDEIEVIEEVSPIEKQPTGDGVPSQVNLHQNDSRGNKNSPSQESGKRKLPPSFENDEDRLRNEDALYQQAKRGNPQNPGTGEVIDLLDGGDDNSGIEGSDEKQKDIHTSVPNIVGSLEGCDQMVNLGLTNESSLPFKNAYAQPEGSDENDEENDISSIVQSVAESPLNLGPTNESSLPSENSFTQPEGTDEIRNENNINSIVQHDVGSPLNLGLTTESSLLSKNAYTQAEGKKIQNAMEKQKQNHEENIEAKYYTLAQSSSDDDSEASQWNLAEHKEPTCEFTGSKFSTRSSNRAADVQRKDSEEMVIDSNEDKTHDSTKKSTRRTARVQRRKAPPPLTNREAIEQNILGILEKIHLKKKAKNRSILERALLQHKSYNQQISSTRSITPRIPATSTKTKYMNHKTSLPVSTDCHSTIVNSSLTVISTVDDQKVKEEIKRKELHDKALDLSLMPYEYKNLQEHFAEVLDSLPVDQRYHPEVHECVSQLLYIPIENTKSKVEVPERFKEAVINDIHSGGSPSKLKDPDENKENYESIMKSFRDFCVQCKTFDCQFHITSYPDAGTQACVAVQYDNRALRASQRESDPNDPFSSLIRGSDNKFVFVDANSECFENPTSMDIMRSNERTKYAEKSTINFNDGDILCAFCKFPCCDQEKLSKHLGRYHQDTYYCREIGSNIGSKITAVVRREGTIKPKREYFHSRSLIPIESGHFDRDSDDESNYSWFQDFRREMLEDLMDVTEKEKRIQNMWNRFIGCSPIVIADRDIPKRCFYFVQKFLTELQELEWELYQLLITFWERHLLTVIHVEKLIHLFHIKRDTEDSNQEEEREDWLLTPRKKIIFSRLYLIFQSLGDDAISRFCESLRRDVTGIGNIENTPMLPKRLWPKLTRNRSIKRAMRKRAEDVSRPFFSPCYHAGRCSLENGCTCIENNNVCTKHCVWGEFGENFFPGCMCTSDCSAAKHCPCRDANRECDPDICRCNANTDGCRKTCGCSNMNVSLAKRTSLLIGRSQVKGAGLGLFTEKALKKGDYIDEYIGEFLKCEYQEGRSEEYYFDHSDDYIMDATHQGNKTRFLNHSLTPNIEASHRFVNGEKRVAFYAKQDIPAQTELFYSYGKSYNKIWRSKGLPHLCVDNDDDGYLD